MSLIDPYLTSRILWKKRKRSTGSRGYESARVIAARVVETSRTTAGPSGRDVIAENRIYVTQDVRIGDLINWRDLNRNGTFDEVEGRTSAPGLLGGIDHYVVTLEP